MIFAWGRGTSQENLAAWGGSAAPALKRDPFGRARTTTVMAQQVAPKGTEPAAGPAPLMCNAVLLGGANPATVINGKSYRVGDSVREYQVAAIGATGVKLIQGSGPDVFLSVYADREHTGRSRIVNGSNQTTGQGRTSLVEHARGERK